MSKYNLIGKKLSHSFSPLIHNEILKYYHDDSSYSLIECEEDELFHYVKKGKEGLYKGFNVTIPYKIKIMKYLDYIDDNALKIGSVNTIKFLNGKAYGYNTDYYGFMEELKYYNINPKNKECYILGTGGASLAINSVLTDLGGKTVFVSRNKIDDNTISYLDLKNKNIDLLVNTTPVGMHPNIDNCPVDDDIIKKSKVVIDIIFNPLKTKLLIKANSNYNGLYMLVYQAIKAEEIWHDLEFKNTKDLYKKIEGEIYE